MANYIYGAISLIGGDTGALNSLDASDLKENDAAMVFTPTATYVYTLKESIGGDQDIPELITPLLNAGTKRWLLVSSRAAESSCDVSLFNGILSATDDDVQKALSTIDDMFSTEDFTIAPGSVSLISSVVKSIGTSSGIVTPVDNTFNILGTGKIKTVGDGENITISSDDLKIVTKLTNYTITANDDIVIGDCSSGDITLTLPQASLKSAITIFKLSNSNTLNINCYGTETIEGVSSYTITKEYDTIKLVSNGTNTWVASIQGSNDSEGYDQIPDATLGTGTYTFDYSQGGMQQLTVTGNITIDFSNFPTGKVVSFIIDAVNWGAFTITHPVGILFSSGVAPTYTSAGTDRLLIIKDKDDVYSLFVIGQGISVTA